MRLSPHRIRALQSILKDDFGLDYTDEETQRAAIAIMRFIVSKQRRTCLKDSHREHNNSKDANNTTPPDNQSTAGA